MRASLPSEGGWPSLIVRDGGALFQSVADAERQKAGDHAAEDYAVGAGLEVREAALDGKLRIDIAKMVEASKGLMM